MCVRGGKWEHEYRCGIKVEVMMVKDYHIFFLFKGKRLS